MERVVLPEENPLQLVQFQLLLKCFVYVTNQTVDIPLFVTSQNYSRMSIEPSIVSIVSFSFPIALEDCSNSLYCWVKALFKFKQEVIKENILCIDTIGKKRNIVACTAFRLPIFFFFLSTITYLLYGTISLGRPLTCVYLFEIDCIIS